MLLEILFSISIFLLLCWFYFILNKPNIIMWISCYLLPTSSWMVTFEHWFGTPVMSISEWVSQRKSLSFCYSVYLYLAIQCYRIFRQYFHQMFTGVRKYSFANLDLFYRRLFIIRAIFKLWAVEIAFFSSGCR